MTTKPLTDNERIKSESDYLRGHILEALDDESTGSVPGDEQQLLKFLGATLQDNRDTRLARKKAGLEREWSFMVRLRLPGGRLSPSQWLEMDRLSDAFGNHTLKLTTRQSIQIHGIIKKNLRSTLQGIHQAALGAIASSGDATRNVMVSLHAGDSPAHRQISAIALRISQELEPRTRAYHEIWLGEKRIYSGQEEEPLYGKSYLPRKFKIAFTLPPDNDVDVYAQDLGFVAIVQEGELEGFDILAGGGMGCAYGNASSFPRLADVVGFCPPEEALDVARAVLLIHRENSDRTDRKLSRLRYTIARKGVAWFRQELETQLGHPLPPARPFTLSSNSDPEDEDASRLSLFVEGGRVTDQGSRRLKTALREIANVLQGDFLITANQNLILTGLTGDTRPIVESILRQNGVDNRFSGLRLHSGACTSLPFCPMSFTDSERYLPSLIDQLEETLRRLNLWELPLTTRMTGCPNGCTRPYVAELAFVGKGPGKYNIWLGGAPNGTRLAYLHREGVPAADIASALQPVFASYAGEHQPGESFGDWANRRRDSLELHKERTK